MKYTIFYVFYHLFDKSALSYWTLTKFCLFFSEQNMKLSRVIVLLRDENVDLRAKNIDIQTDYVILDESYKNFITVSIAKAHQSE